MAIGDVTGDGMADVVVGNNGQSHVLVNNGSGDPATFDRVTLGSPQNQTTYSVAIGDVTCDGLADVVEGNYVQQNHVLVNNGSGDPSTFNRADLGSAVNDTTYSVAIADVNGDSRLDVVVGNGGQNYVLANNGSGDPSSFSRIELGSPTNDETRSVSVGDVTGDGRPDVAVGNFNQQSYVLVNNGAAMPFGQVGYHIQVARDTNDWAGSMAWDSGVTNLARMGDGLATVSTPAVLTNWAPHFWRARLFSASRYQGPWSAPQRFVVSGPSITITTTPTEVRSTVTSYTVAGVSDHRIVGRMWWSNDLTGDLGTLAATSSWRIDNIPLKARANTIVVCGTNTAGRIVSDSIVITRGMSNEMFLITPEDGVVTNVLEIRFDVFFGNDITPDRQYLSTNAGGSWFLYTNLVTFSSDGEYPWTAMGFDQGWIQYFATSTNMLVIMTNAPTVRLVSPPPGAVLRNQFAVPLVADYGVSRVSRELSTNSGASWFMYTPGTPVYFTSTGTWQWTARGRIANWGYAATTNELTLLVAGASPAIRLVSPANGVVTTTNTVLFSVVQDSFSFTRISTNNGFSWSVINFPGQFTMTASVYRWTAHGVNGLPPTNCLAPTTNQFEILRSDAVTVRLAAPEPNASRPPGHVAFDVFCVNTSGLQLSTNNGADWFVYTNGAPLQFMEPQSFFWLARATNSAGAWVTASVSNKLTIVPDLPFVDLTNGTMIADITLPFHAAGTNNDFVVNTMWISNDANGECVFFPAKVSWRSPDITLEWWTNRLYVFGANWSGETTNDSVIIIGVPECAGGACLALGAALVTRRRLRIESHK